MSDATTANGLPPKEREERELCRVIAMKLTTELDREISDVQISQARGDQPLLPGENNHTVIDGAVLDRIFVAVTVPPTIRDKVIACLMKKGFRISKEVPLATDADTFRPNASARERTVSTSNLRPSVTSQASTRTGRWDNVRTSFARTSGGNGKRIAVAALVAAALLVLILVPNPINRWWGNLFDTAPSVATNPRPADRNPATTPAQTTQPAQAAPPAAQQATDDLNPATPQRVNAIDKRVHDHDERLTAAESDIGRLRAGQSELTQRQSELQGQVESLQTRRAARQTVSTQTAKPTAPARSAARQSVRRSGSSSGRVTYSTVYLTPEELEIARQTLPRKKP